MGSTRFLNDCNTNPATWEGFCEQQKNYRSKMYFRQFWSPRITLTLNHIYYNIEPITRSGNENHFHRPATRFLLNWSSVDIQCDLPRS